MLLLTDAIASSHKSLEELNLSDFVTRQQRYWRHRPWKRNEAVEECISEGVFKNIPIEECRKSLNQTADKISDIFKNRHFNEVDEHYFLNNLKLNKKYHLSY